MTIDLFMAYALMLVWMTLTLMQGHSGSAKAKIQCWILSTTKQATRIKLAKTVDLFFFFYVILTLQTFIWLDHLVLLSKHLWLPFMSAFSLLISHFWHKFHCLHLRRSRLSGNIMSRLHDGTSYCSKLAHHFERTIVETSLLLLLRVVACLLIRKVDIVCWIDETSARCWYKTATWG